MNILVIEVSRRSLSTFVASATQVSEDDRWIPRKVVLRHAADGPSLAELGDLPDTTMPILLVGGGYNAQSSEGFVRVNADGPTQSVWVVGAAGCMGAKSLRPLGRPQLAVMLPPSALKKVVSRGSNANWQVKQAVEAAASLFGKATQTTTIVEGQSNYALSFTLKPVEGWAWPELHQEHQDRFSDANLFEAALKDRSWFLERLSENDEQDEEQKAEAKKTERRKRTAYKLGITIVHKAWLDAIATDGKIREMRPSALTLNGVLPEGDVVKNLHQHLADKRAELEGMGWKAHLHDHGDAYGDLFVVSPQGQSYKVGFIYGDVVKAHLGVETIVGDTDEA